MLSKNIVLSNTKHAEAELGQAQPKLELRLRVEVGLENEFVKKTPSPKLDLSPCLGLSTLEFVNTI